MQEGCAERTGDLDPGAARQVAEIVGADAIRLALKTEACAPWDADDYRAFYHERAGIAHFDGGLSRPEAEALAFACCVAEWLSRNPVRSSPGRCLACGGREHPNGRLLPFGAGSTGHAWLHGRCWPRLARRAQGKGRRLDGGIRHVNTGRSVSTSFGGKGE